MFIRSGYQPVNISLPDAGGFDAERRRQKALQQLNDRLQKTEQLDTSAINEETAKNNAEKVPAAETDNTNNEENKEQLESVVVQ